MLKKTGLVLTTLATVEASKLRDINARTLMDTQAKAAEAHEHTVEAQYYQHGEKSLLLIESSVGSTIKASESFTPTTCSSGIQRFTNGTSNSIEAYEGSQEGTLLWEDPEFGADVSSLRWDDYGFAIQGSSSPPKTLLWKRPNEMGQGYPEEPSFWGDYN